MTKLMILLLVLGVVIISEVESACQCSELTLQDHRDQTIGKCLSKYKGKSWCYVPSNSDCLDKTLSKRDGDLYWSADACEKGENSCSATSPFNVAARGPCIFPFTYDNWNFKNGKTFNGCTKLGSNTWRDAWCKIKEEQTGNWWGVCDEDCPMHSEGELVDGTCYENDGFHLLDDSPSNTPDQCKIACAKQRYMYSGVQDGNQCYCGNDNPPASRIRESSQCDKVCPGDALVKCGGTSRMNVYKTTYCQINIRGNCCPCAPSIWGGKSKGYICRSNDRCERDGLFLQ